jgi:hypothetical protein
MNLRKATLTDYGVPPDDIPALQSHFRHLDENDKYNPYPLIKAKMPTHILEK